MLTGLSADTFDKLQLDAGIFLKNLDWSKVTTATALAAAIESAKTAGNYLGATSGGGTFEATPNTREIEADGIRSPFVGSTRNDGWDVKLTTTILEITAENIKLALGSGDVTTSDKVTKITARTDYADTDYIETMQWVGNLSDGSGIVLIEINNALCTSGMKFTFKDKGEGNIPLELIAHQDSATDQTKAPFTVAIFTD